MLISGVRRRVSVTASSERLHPNPVLHEIFATRGVAQKDELDYSLARMHPPGNMLGIDRAAELLADVIEAQQFILIVGDFDADGATSSALSVLALRAMGGRVDYLVPNRFDYGYGLTPEIVAVAARSKPDIIVTVDNGISSIDGVSAARELGMKVLITDHHLPGSKLPTAEVIVNPNQRGCAFPSKNLAGVGVIFYVMIALRSVLRQRGWFLGRGIVEPVMADYLDLVALGTVADVVPLDSNNRMLVSQGLARIRAGRVRPGIEALLKIGKREVDRVCAADLGFAVGPRLNAAGRLDDMSAGIECLLASDDGEALRRAGELDDLNLERRSIEADMQQTAMTALERLSFEGRGELPTGLCLYDPGWHQGVIGILASRVKDRYHRPVIAFADAGDGWIKGSARSIPGLHIRDALDSVAALNPGLLSKFGGHAMAAGMTIRREDYDAFSQAFDEEAARWLDEDALRNILPTDGELAAEYLTMEFAETLFRAGPWGQHFPEPVFEGEFKLLQQRLVGERHLKLVVAPVGAGSVAIDGIAFNVDTELWPFAGLTDIYLCYRLDINRFRGESNLQLMVEYLEPRST